MSYWDRTLAKAYRLQADRIAAARVLSGARPDLLIAELRQRADEIDPGQDLPLPAEARPVTLSEWLRGIRSTDGEAITVKPWVQPAGAHDAVRLGEYRAHGGVNWRSKIPANTTEPGSDPRWWVQEDPALDAEPEEPVEVTPWAPDLAVTTGQLLSHDGRLYSVVQDHTTAAQWVPGSPGLESLYTDEGLA